MTEKREQYMIHEPKHMPVDPQPEPSWRVNSEFAQGYEAALRYMHYALFFEHWKQPMAGYKLVQKIRAACLDGELSEGEA